MAASNTPPLHEDYELVQSILKRRKEKQVIGPLTRSIVELYIEEAILAVGNGSIELDEELQQEFPNEWANAQDAIADRDGYNPNENE